MANYTYAIGDIHGMYTLMCNALNWIHNDKPDDNITVVFLGDYIDRGPDSAVCVTRIKNLIQHGECEDTKYIALKGNHEDMMCNNTASDIHIWLYNGGTQTIESYDQVGFSPSDMDEDRKFLRTLPTAYSDKFRYYAHAAYFDNKTVHGNESLDHMRMWYRYQKTEEPNLDKYVVHGHTPQREYPFVGISRCNLDVGSCWSNMLAVARFDDEKEGGPEHIEIIV